MFLKKSINLWIVAALSLAVFGCSSPSSPSTSGGTGSLSLTFGNSVSRTLLPPLSMDPASYTVTGTGPNSATFTRTMAGTETSVTVGSLAFGSWSITVDAYNNETPAPTLIGTGSASTTVHTGLTATATVTVTPLTGTGVLDLTVNWPDSDVQNASISASLAPFSGSSATLPFSSKTVNTGIATETSHNTGIATGYSTLALSLLDGAIVEAGTVEVVRIVKGQTTSGTYTLAVNQVGGAIQIIVITNMENALTVAVAGASASPLAPGTSETLTASVTNYTGTVAYVWYVGTTIVQNGGASYHFVAPLTSPNSTSAPDAYYNITVTAFNSDGTQAGSETVPQTVDF